MASGSDRRRQKRLAKQKKKRGSASRPSKDGGTAARPPSAKTGRDWPIGDCYATSEFGEAEATLHLVFCRSHADGRTIAAFTEVDRSGPGITSLRVQGLPATANVLAECGRLSEKHDVAFQGLPPGLVAGLLIDALDHGAQRPRAAGELRTLMEDVELVPADPPFGPPQAEEAPQRSLLSRWTGGILG